MYIHINIQLETYKPKYDIYAEINKFMSICILPTEVNLCQLGKRIASDRFGLSITTIATLENYSFLNCVKLQILLTFSIDINFNTFMR